MKEYISEGANIIEVEHNGRQYKIVHYTKPEEVLNAVTHGVGALLFLIGLVWLLTLSKGNAMNITASFLLCTPAIVVYTVSTIYHSTIDVRKKYYWRKIDHSDIPFIVLGCSAPICLCISTNPYNFIALGLSFAFAAINIALNIKSVDKFKVPSMIINFVVGVLLFGVYLDNRALIPIEVKYFYFVGTALCILGSIIFAIKVRYVHCIFHIFELVGTMMFFGAAVILISA